MAIDITDDYAIFDNTESLTLILKRNAGDTSVTVANGLRGRLSRSELTSLGAYLNGDELSFFLPGDQVGSSNTIYSGDTVTDGASAVYTITSTSRSELGTSLSGWRCIVRPER